MSNTLINKFLKASREHRINIHCLGDAMVDEFYDVKVNRISPEFPMPIMSSISDTCHRRPGGVANVAHQFKHFNVDVKLMCLADRMALRLFEIHGIKHFNVDRPSKAKLPIKKRFLVNNYIQVNRHDIESPYCGMTQQEIFDHLIYLADYIKKEKFPPHVAIFSDYNKGFFKGSNGNSYVDLLNCYPETTITIVDPKKGPLEKWIGCTIFKPNAAEAESLTGLSDWKEQAKYLQSVLGCQSVVITFSGEKVAGIHHGEYFESHLQNKVSVDSVVGAGDCFCAFLAMAVGLGFSVPEAAQIADQAGSIYVQHEMNKPVSPSELCLNGIVVPEDLRNRSYRLVFANGCFDVLHDGHMKMLEFAKSKGDKLVVALNSDESVKRLKGENRPLVPLAQRMAVMSNIRHVDFVCYFEENTPYEILKKIRPDVLVKGAQYDIKDIIGVGIVPEIYQAPMIEGLSTSNLLKNI